MFTLYGDLGSGAFSAEAALAEAGAPYRFELVSLERNEQRQPAFLAINPSGKMPALKISEGEIITESAAILLTLADYFPQARLLPPQASQAWPASSAQSAQSVRSWKAPIPRPRRRRKPRASLR